jgi:hypothetical protein
MEDIPATVLSGVWGDILYIPSTINIMGHRTGLLDEQVWYWVFRHVFIALSANPGFAYREYRLRY